MNPPAEPVQLLPGDEQPLMAWVRYDDGFYSHPKVTAVIAEDPAALSLHVLANTWTNAQKRPGFVPAHQPGILIADRSLGAQWAKVLVAHGLWHEVTSMCDECMAEFSDLAGGSGYVIHDAKHYRAPDRDRTTPGTPAELSEKRRAAGRKGGKATAAKRGGKQPTQANDADADSSKSSNLLFAGVSKDGNLLLGGVSPEPVPVTTDASNEASAAETGGTNEAESEAAAEPITARTILGEYIDRCRKRPPERVLGQMAKQIKELLDQDFEPDDIRRGIAHWMTRDTHPSVLPSIVNNLVNNDRGNVTELRPTGTDTRFAPGTGSQVPDRNDYETGNVI